MLLKRVGKLQPDELFSITSVTPACYSFWAVTGQTAVKAQKNTLLTKGLVCPRIKCLDMQQFTQIDTKYYYLPW